MQRYAQELSTRLGDRMQVLEAGGTGRGIAGHLWEQQILPFRVGRRVLWSPCNTGPLRVKRQVVSIHDCAFIDMAGGFSRAFTGWYQYLVPRLARRVARIITGSEYSRGRIVELLGVKPEKVSLIPYGVDPGFRKYSDEAISQIKLRLALPEQYVLCVGSLEPRKNLPRLLESWKLVAAAHPQVRLVIVGARNASFRDAGLVPLPPNVCLAGYLQDEELKALYSGASVFVYPSLYEGFGFPVLEAMACGAPVVTANATSLPEVAGTAAVLVDPLSVESLADGISRVLDEPGLAAKLREKGRMRAAEFRWDTAAEATWKVLAEV